MISLITALDIGDTSITFIGSYFANHWEDLVTLNFSRLKPTDADTIVPTIEHFAYKFPNSIMNRQIENASVFLYSFSFLFFS